MNSWIHNIIIKIIGNFSHTNKGFFSYLNTFHGKFAPQFFFPVCVLQTNFRLLQYYGCLVFFFCSKRERSNACCKSDIYDSRRSHADQWRLPHLSHQQQLLSTCATRGNKKKKEHYFTSWNKKKKRRTLHLLDAKCQCEGSRSVFWIEKTFFFFF